MFFKQQLLYVEILKNQIRVTNTSNNKQICANGEFSNERLAIAHFKETESQLSSVIKEVFTPSFTQTLTVVMHQQVNNLGGLCEIEERILMELGYGLGARTVHIWQGDKLSNEQLLREEFEP